MKQRLLRFGHKVAGTCMVASGIMALMLPRGIQLYTCIGCTILFGAVCLKAKYTENPYTNADYIRRMSDDELAAWICENVECCDCPVYGLPDSRTQHERCNMHVTCIEANLLGWLKRERVKTQAGIDTIENQ